jgi:hypothetical protein
MNFLYYKKKGKFFLNIQNSNYSNNNYLKRILMIFYFFRNYFNYQNFFQKKILEKQ